MQQFGCYLQYIKHNMKTLYDNMTMVYYYYYFLSSKTVFIYDYY